MRKTKMHHVTPLLKHLHWLPVKKRIEYKILLLTFKALHGEAPSYIQEMLHPYIPSKTLRSADKLQLIEKRMTRKHGDRAFSSAAPKLWNALPLPLQLSKNSYCFKKALQPICLSVLLNSISCTLDHKILLEPRQMKRLEKYPRIDEVIYKNYNYYYYYHKSC